MVDHIFEIKNVGGNAKDLRLSELNTDFFSYETLEHIHSDAVKGIATALNKMFNISTNETISCVSTIEDSISWKNLSFLRTQYAIIVYCVLFLFLIYLMRKIYLECHSYRKHRAAMRFHRRKKAE